MLMFQEMRQQEEATRQQLLHQSQIQQQMFTFFSGCLGTLYRHSDLPEPLLPRPPPHAGGFIQTPLALFSISPLLQIGVFAAPAPDLVL